MPYVIIYVNGEGECIKEKKSSMPEQSRVQILNSYVKKVLLFQCKEFIIDKKMDYLNLYRMIPIKNREMWSKYEDNQINLLRILQLMWKSIFN